MKNFLLDVVLLGVALLIWARIMTSLLAPSAWTALDRVEELWRDVGDWRARRQHARATPPPAPAPVPEERTPARMPDTDPLTCDECHGTTFSRYPQQPELLICSTCQHACNHEGGVNAPYNVPPASPPTDPMERVRRGMAARQGQ